MVGPSVRRRTVGYGSIAMKTCPACLATYNPAQGDGWTYIHGCPGISPTEAAALAAGQSLADFLQANAVSVITPQGDTLKIAGSARSVAQVAILYPGASAAAVAAQLAPVAAGQPVVGTLG